MDLGPWIVGVETPPDVFLFDLPVVRIGYTLKDIEDEGFIKVGPSCFIEDVDYNGHIAFYQGHPWGYRPLYMGGKAEGFL